jgi:hypothetical protein
MNRRDALTMAGFCLLLLLGPIGILWAVGDGIPAYGDGAPSDAGDDWLSKGTNLSAPLPILIVFALALVLARRPDGWGTAATTVVALVSVVFIAASVGEPFVPAQADSPAILLVVFHLILYAVTAVVLVLAIRELLARRSARLQGGAGLQQGERG